MTIPELPDDLLPAARDLITSRGWVRGWFGSPACGYCIAGAVYAAAGVLEPGGDLRDPVSLRDHDTHRQCDATLRALCRAAGVGTSPSPLAAIAEWSDDARTKADVLALFDKAIAATATVEAVA